MLQSPLTRDNRNIIIKIKLLCIIHVATTTYTGTLRNHRHHADTRDTLRLFYLLNWCFSSPELPSLLLPPAFFVITQCYAKLQVTPCMQFKMYKILQLASKRSFSFPANLASLARNSLERSRQDGLIS